MNKKKSPMQIAKDTIDAKINSLEEFNMNEIKKEIKKAGGLLHVASGVTVKEYVEQKVYSGVIGLNSDSGLYVPLWHIDKIIDLYGADRGLEIMLTQSREDILYLLKPAPSTSSITRRFERFLMNYGHDPNEPPDDRKTFEDMRRYPPRRQQFLNSKNSKPIGIITTNIETGETTYKKL